MNNTTLVSCIMPTCNRRAFVPYAIEYFLAQDHPEKELVIVDDGDDAIADLVPEHTQIRYLRTAKFATLGEKRNFCIEQSKGDLIMHWDDDDWMAPHRISYQLNEMLNHHAAVCGLQQMYFYETGNGNSWLYQYPSNSKTWLAGGSLLYTRDFWKEKKFPHRQVASDTDFILSRTLRAYHILPDHSIYIARIHAQNTSPKATGQSWWQPVENTTIVELMGEKHWLDLLQTGETVSDIPLEGKHKKSVAILITTCEREEQLQQLIAALQSEEDTFRLSFFIQDDSLLGHGKTGYWKTINSLWQQVKGQAFDYYIHIQDDAIPGDAFIAKAVQRWEALRDPKKICLNLFLDASRLGKTCWTGQWAQIHEDNGTRFLRTQWMDMFCFISEVSFFEQLAWMVKPVPAERWIVNPELSSGVGQQISTRLHQQGLCMYQVSEHLVDHGGQISRMNPDVRKREPLHATTLDPVYAGMATIPGRESQLKKAIASLLPYVDQLYLFLHDVIHVPEWMKKMKKLTVILSKDEAGRWGDAGKFVGLDKIKDKHFYYFSVDDDMIYPPDYTWKMIRKIDDYQRQCVISCGGYNMKPDVKHFYNDRLENWHVAIANPVDRPVHILHSGLAAWYSSALRFSHRDCALPNMSDLWLALAAQQQEVPMLVTEHMANWVKTQALPLSQTIYGRYRDQCDAQTQIYHSWDRWTIHTGQTKERTLLQPVHD